jgi:UDP-N-acetyl-D-mannosaminuronic acid dehydrogenase
VPSQRSEIARRDLEAATTSSEAGLSELDVCLIGGCGHVGLPLALSFAKSGLSVGIFDTDADKVELVAAGTMPFLEDNADALLLEVLEAGRLEVSANPEIIRRAPVVVLIVGTPIDEFMNPSLRIFERVVDQIEPYVREHALLVLRSTVYPGITEWVANALVGRGRSIEVVFCPERIVEGRALAELVTLPQIVGADSTEAADRAAELFARLHVSIVRTSRKEAELAKLFTNAWRYLKFAIANEFFVIANEAGVDYSNVLEAIRHEYPRAQDLPAPGFAAGPCLLKDTMQLSAFDGHNFALGQAAMLVNEGLPDKVVRAIESSGGLRDKHVALLGMAFKAGSDDVRDSLSYKLKRLLWFAGAHVACTDPYVVGDPELVSLEKALADAEIVIIGAPHAEYAELDFGERRLVDIWGLCDGSIKL